MSGLGEASFQYELPRQAFFMLVGMVTRVLQVPGAAVH